MDKIQIIHGFSRLSREEKIRHILSVVDTNKELSNDFKSHLHTNPSYQKRYEEFSENTVTNYFLPFSLAPNFFVNGKFYMVPMVIEESSVVAAASAAAKYWAVRGGFHSKVISAIKTGQVHFLWRGDVNNLVLFFDNQKRELIKSAGSITKNMRKRGGGIIDIELLDKREKYPDYFQLHVKFDTADSMGANFINSVLENIAKVFEYKIQFNENFSDKERNIEIIMSILSNYSPECLVETEVQCSIDQLESNLESMPAHKFVNKLKQAVDIANADISRAVTHNKGIFNGIDSVMLATGNDFRAIEAQGHAYAAKDGQYSALSEVSIENNIFHFKLKMPISLGTVGGITRLHPLAKRSLELLGNPNAKELMQIASSVGLASNFSSIKSLVTKGIQAGHMRMHLKNILRSFNAGEEEINLAVNYFKNKKISHNTVEHFLDRLRKKEK